MGFGSIKWHRLKKYEQWVFSFDMVYKAWSGNNKDNKIF